MNNEIIEKELMLIGDELSAISEAGLPGSIVKKWSAYKKCTEMASKLIIDVCLFGNGDLVDTVKKDERIKKWIYDSMPGLGPILTLMGLRAIENNSADEFRSAMYSLEKILNINIERSHVDYWFKRRLFVGTESGLATIEIADNWVKVFQNAKVFKDWLSYIDVNLPDSVAVDKDKVSIPFADYALFHKNVSVSVFESVLPISPIAIKDLFFERCVKYNRVDVLDYFYNKDHDFFKSLSAKEDFWNKLWIDDGKPHKYLETKYACALCLIDWKERFLPSQEVLDWTLGKVNENTLVFDMREVSKIVLDQSFIQAASPHITSRWERLLSVLEKKNLKISSGLVLETRPGRVL